MRREDRLRALGQGPPLPNAGETNRYPIPDTYEGIKREIGRMVQFVNHYAGDRFVRQTAEHILLACAAMGVSGDEGKKDCAIEAIFHWCKNNFNFVNDPVDKELIKAPPKMIGELRTPPEVLAQILGPQLVAGMDGHAGIEMSPAQFFNLGQQPRPSCIRANGQTVCSKMSGDCVPYSQRIILRDRVSDKYVVKEIGDLENEYSRYDALSYNFEAERFEFKPILQFRDKGVRQPMRIRTSHGLEFAATSNHDLYFFTENRGVRRPRKGGVTARLYKGPLGKVLGRGLRKPGNRLIPVASRIPDLGTLERPLDVLWLEGLYVAEGWNSGGKVAIGVKDPALVRRVRGVLTKHGVPHSVRTRGDGLKTVAIKRSAMKYILPRRFGTGSFEKKVPEEYRSLSLPGVTALLEGYADGDAYKPAAGSVWAKRARLIHNTSSGKLAAQLLFMHMIAGRPLSPHLQRRHGGAGTKPIWRLMEYHRNNGYSDIVPGLYGRPVEKATKLPWDQVCDITVADNFNFVTEQGIVLSNCDDAAIVVATLLSSVGIDPRLEFGGDESGGECEAFHTWASGLGDRGWVQMDITRQESHPGWEWPRFGCRFHVDVA